MNTTIIIIGIYYWFSTFYCLGRKIDVDGNNTTGFDVLVVFLTSWFLFPFVLGIKYR